VKVNITIKNRLKINIPADTFLCHGDSLWLYPQASGGDSTQFTYTWTKKGVAHSTQKNILIGTTTGDTSIYKIGMYDGCAADTAFDSLKVSIYNPLKVYLSADTLLCLGDTLFVQQQTTGGNGNPNFYWTQLSDTGNYLFLGGTYSGFQQISKESVTVKVLVNDGCSISDSAQIHINVAQPIHIYNPIDTAICPNTFYPAKFVLTGGYKPQLYWTAGINVYSLVDSILFNVYPIFDTTVTVSATDLVCPTASENLTIKIRDPLSIKIYGPDSVCLNDTIRIYSKQYGGYAPGYLWRWVTSMGDTIASDSFALYHSSIPGDFKVAVVLQDGCTMVPAIDTLTIKVYDFPSQLIINDTHVCEGNTLILKTRGDGGKGYPYHYRWQMQNISGAWTEMDTTAYIRFGNPTHSDSTQNIYYRSIIHDGCKLLKDTELVAIHVLPALSVLKPSDTLLCYGQEITLTAAAKGGKSDAYTWKWMAQKTHLSDSNWVTVKPTISTRYSAIVNDGYCKSDTDWVTVNVREPLNLVNESQFKFCDLAPLTLQVKPSGGVDTSYLTQWYDMAGNMIQLGSTYITNNNPDTLYKIILNDGCSLADSLDITVHIEQYPSPLFSTGETSICQNEEFHIYNETSGLVDTNNIYIWSWGDGAKDTTSWVDTLAHGYAAAGWYNQRLTIITANGCDTSFSSGSQLNVKAIPNASIIAAPLKVSIDSPYITFSNNSTGAISFGWAMGDGYQSSTTSLLPFVYKYADTGWYSVKMIAANNELCTDTALLSVRVFEPFKLFVPNAFTPNKNGLNDVFAPSILAYRNYKLYIYNRWGQLVALKENEGWTAEGCMDGLYLYLIIAVDSEGFTHEKYGSVMLFR
jgi:hypothetical protein